MGQSRMDNLKTQATLDTRHMQHWTQDTGNIGHKTQKEDNKAKAQLQKTKKMSNTNPTKQPRVNLGARVVRTDNTEN